MSAQAGVWNFDGRPVDQAFLGRLSSAIEVHGPDGGNAHIDESIGMVYRAFHTTSESRLERQPYMSARGNVITWDGRLDNRDELIPRLPRELIANPTDIAIVSAAFDLWGMDCFHRIIGDWAVSIWKPLERELLFACDYMAIRHIFYYPKKDCIWWSTDLASLVLLSGDKFHIDDRYVAGYFANDPDADLTPYREIRQVPAGQFVRIRNGKASVERHWRFNPKSRIRYKTDADYEEHFRHVFRQSVHRRLRSDSPILAELSGGIDSSSIVCMADDIMIKERGLTPCLDTFSYYDKTEPEGDDWVYFQVIEERRGKSGVHIDVSKYGESVLIDYPEFHAIPGYLGAGVKLEAERGEVVRMGGYRSVLSGFGGDEFMGGIPDPRPHLADLIVQCSFVGLLRQLVAWSLVKKKPLIQLFWQASTDLLPARMGKYLIKEAKVEPWVKEDFAARMGLKLRQFHVSEVPNLCLPTRRAYLGGLVRMANKMAKRTPPSQAVEEPRYPYLDQTLIEFILSIPANQLLRPGQRRSLMRRSLIAYVPQQVLFRRTKGTAARTPALAVERNWNLLREIFRSPLTSQFGYVDQASFVRALDAFRAGKELHVIRILKAISLEFWLRHLASRELLASPAEDTPSISSHRVSVGERTTEPKSFQHSC